VASLLMLSSLRLGPCKMLVFRNVHSMPSLWRVKVESANWVRAGAKHPSFFYVARVDIVSLLCSLSFIFIFI
jgi:hypothetical protein